MGSIPGSAAPDIPVLKKSENSKKGTGFIWPGARLASGLGNWAGGSSTWLGSVLLSPSGPWLASGLVAGLFAGGLAGGTYFMSRAFSPARAPAAPASALPASDGVGASGIRIYKPRDVSLEDVSRANPGALKFGEQQAAFLTKANQAAQAETPAPKTEAAKPAAQDPNALAESLKAQMGLTGAQGQIGKLSTGTGGSFGSWNNLSKNTLGSQDNRFQLKNNFAQAPALSKPGKFSSMASKQALLASSKLSRLGVTASRAMGQLKWGSNRSVSGATAKTEEVGHTYASDAFDQQATQNGQLSQIGGMGVNQGAGSGIVNPQGSGAPNPTPAPSPGAGQNVTPWQPQVNAAQNATSNTWLYMILGVALIAAGVALCVHGGLWGWIAGIALILSGIFMMVQSFMSANTASDYANQINQKYGQQAESQAINDCTNQALGKVNPKDCKSNPPSQLQPGNSQVGPAAHTERDANYDIGVPINK